MSDRQYSTMLALLILPPLVALIAERLGIDESSANLPGRAVYDLFHRTGADDYIRRSFGALHTVGEQYVLDDIDGYVQSRI